MYKQYIIIIHVDEQNINMELGRAEFYMRHVRNSKYSRDSLCLTGNSLFGRDFSISLFILVPRNFCWSGFELRLRDDIEIQSVISRYYRDLIEGPLKPLDLRGPSIGPP